MTSKFNVLEQRRNAFAFWFGGALVTAGVVLHLPMYLMARNSGFILAGMPMGVDMLLGMAAIVIGYAFAGYGLLPTRVAGATPAELEALAPPEDAPLTRAHWAMAGLLSLALIIDIMKPASLGFVTPGMRAEYAVSAAMVAWLPFAALAGTALGSFAWGLLADIYGRRAAILLSSVMFVGTSICGAMPDFWWNVFMCFLMGAAAGGMLPVAYALLAEIMPTRHRGWSLVLVGGIGAVGGYLAASALSALLQPVFGWRILWFLNLPTGLILIALSPLLPESARFLQRMGRIQEARIVLARFGAVLRPKCLQACTVPHGTQSPASRGTRRYYGLTIALTLIALVWGLANFGLLLWLPSALVAQGRSVADSSALIAKATLIAAPTALVCAWSFSSWSTKWSLVAAIALTVAGMLGLALEAGARGLSHPAIPLSAMIIGSSGVISILLPYAAENYPLRFRGRATGWIAGCSKLGGLIAQTLSVIGVAPPFATSLLVVASLGIVALTLLVSLGPESKGRDLRELEPGATPIFEPPVNVSSAWRR